jgi:hypothetical protein
LARRVAERNEWKQATPLDRTVKDARKLMDKTSHYDDVKMMDRKTMDSRAASIGIVYGENGKLNIEDQMKSANFSSPLYMGFANSAKSDTADRRRDAREHLGDIGEALGFSTGDIINPSQMELRDTFDGVFGMSQEEAQNEVRSERRTQPSSEIFSHSHFAVASLAVLGGPKSSAQVRPRQGFLQQRELRHRRRFLQCAEAYSAKLHA